MELDARLLITMAGMLISVVSSFIVVRQKVQEIEKSIEHLFRKASTIDTSLDKNNLQTEAMTRELDRLNDINSPSNLKKKNREMASFEVKIMHLEDRISKVEEMHNGDHPVIKT
jgi:predicted RNase H-like nuclease (RuvC/YqgF family)